MDRGGVFGINLDKTGGIPFSQVLPTIPRKPKDPTARGFRAQLPLNMGLGFRV